MKQKEDQPQESSHFFPNGLPQRKTKTVVKPKPKEATTPGPLDNNDYWFWGESPTLHQLRSDTRIAANSDATILIIGETGVGKEVIATIIHEEHKRKNNLLDKEAPLVSVNCAAIPESLSESILFGHERGAFTSARDRKQGKFELALKGSIFLDEIQNLDKAIQAKLLRVLQSKQIEPLGSKGPKDLNCRFITATNIPLELLVKNGLFRRDLFYRLNVCPLYIPALRERMGDFEKILHGLQKRIKTEHSIKIKKVSDEAMDALKKHDWPGNIRELEHALIYAALRCDDVITKKALPPSAQGIGDEYLKKGLWDLDGCFKALS